MLKTGQVLKQRYEVLQDLAQGGSSRVYLVCDRVSRKKRALKEVAALADAKMCDIAKREAEFIRKLNYPYFPEIFEVLSVRHADYIVMEYLEGETLGNRLRRLGPQPCEEVARWGKDLCLMLGYLHQRIPQTIYGDMKPDNVMIQSAGNLRLIDFGAITEISEHKKPRLIFGTRGYAAPEQFDWNMGVDARTDVYSLGMTLYQLLTGNRPDQIAERGFFILGSKKKLSRTWIQVITRCIREHPEDRYQDCRELCESLRRI